MDKDTNFIVTYVNSPIGTRISKFLQECQLLGHHEKHLDNTQTRIITRCIPENDCMIACLSCLANIFHISHYTNIYNRI